MRWRAGLAVGAAFALLLVQCSGGTSKDDDGSVLLPPRSDLVDSSVDATLDSATDTTTDGKASGCNIGKPFGAPTAIPELDAPTHRATPRLSADELTIYFTTTGATTNADLSVVSRPFKTSPFALEAVLAQSGASNDNDPSVGPDHLSLWFHSGRSGTSADIFVATRAAPSGPFGMAVAVDPVNTPASNEAHAYVRAAGNELWFVSDRPGGAGLYDIYVSVRAGAAFGAPTRVVELSSASQEFQPQPSEDGLTVLFASDRPGGLGGTDLWIARRATATASWDAPTPITELNSASGESAGWMSADGCRIWFGSSRENVDDHTRLYFAERPR